MTGLTNNCDGCGRAIAPVSETCADCLTGERDPTLSDFVNGEEVCSDE